MSCMGLPGLPALPRGLENGMPLKWELVSPGLACFHGNLDEVNELLLLINCVCVSTNNNYLPKV